MAVKKVLLTKKIAGTLYRVYPKTSADQVVYDDTQTVAERLADIATELASTSTTENIETMISEATTNLYNKIMGLTDETTTVAEAYDTLKEVADYLTSHGEEVVSITSSISALEDAVEALDYSKVTASETNGNIVVDGEEMTVYTLPQLTADDIEETDDKLFLTAAERETIAGCGTANYEDVTEEPDDESAEENTLYFVYEE